MPLSFEEILSDRDRGASEIEEELLRALPRSPEEVQLLARAVLRLQPGMANLLRLVDDLFLSLAAGKPLSMERGAEDPGPALRSALGGRTTVLTLSRSGTVLRGLAGMGGLRVIVGEGRPRREGLALAADLAAAGLETRVVTDAALCTLLLDPGPLSPAPRSAAVVVGADAISSEWFLNKVGTHALALAARETGVPVLVVAGRSKLLPPALADAVQIQVMDPAELDAPAGVGAVNLYFERVPLARVDRVVLGSEVCAPAEAARRAAGLPVSPRFVQEIALWRAGERAP